MYKPTMSDIKTIRSRTGAGIKDCKTALAENNGDFDAAIDWLRTKGIAKAVKKSGRIATEGTIFALVSGTDAALVEVNCETDFVARTDGFKAFVKEAAEHIIQNKPADVDALMGQTWHDGSTVKEAIQQMVFKTGENIRLRRFDLFSAGADGVLHSYIHTGSRLGVLVEVTAGDHNDKVTEFVDELAMHIAASRPEFLNVDAIPEDVIEKEFAIQKARIQEDDKMKGRPEKIINGAVTGRIKKWQKGISLVDQFWIHDDGGKLPVGSVLKNLAPETGGSLSVARFVTFELGQGLEKRVDNFADEVAAMANN